MADIDQMGRKEVGYPEALAAYAGEINDLDAHEVIPMSRWVEAFGQEAAHFVEASRSIVSASSESANGAFDPRLEDDDAEINLHNVWKLKYEKAPGAFNFDRRLEVMDFTGVKRQVMYPGGLGLLGQAFYHTCSDPKVMASIPGSASERRRFAKRMLELYNRWCGRLYREQDRLRPVAILLEETPEDYLASMRRMIDQGIRMFQISCDTPPAGLSPADPRLDPVWALAADADAALLAHIVPTQGFLATLKWRDAPAFEGWMAGGEFSFDPWTLSNIHLAVQNFLTTMVLGGVFERHPRLRFGTAEFTGHWIGPFATNMDRWYEHMPFPVDIGEKVLKMRPSDYVRRNVRVACFDFEPVGEYIDNFGFEDVLCYASDYPHYEGGKDTMNRFVRQLEGQSDEVVRKFFIENGQWLLPD